jgi:hypothetical protein
VKELPSEADTLGPAFERYKKEVRANQEKVKWAYAQYREAQRDLAQSYRDLEDLRRQKREGEQK